MSCDYKDCHVPESRHNECAAAGISKCWGRLSHQHVPKRSQTSRAERQCPVMLCLGHHGNIDDHSRYEGLRLADGIDTLAGGGRVYVIWNRNSLDIDPLVQIELLDTEGGEANEQPCQQDEEGSVESSAPPSMPGNSRESRASC